jgi:hypothetical protein
MQVAIKKTLVQNSNISAFFAKNQPGYDVQKQVSTLDGQVNIKCGEPFDPDFDILELPKTT